jgi:hypothetical protein
VSLDAPSGDQGLSKRSQRVARHWGRPTFIGCLSASVGIFNRLLVGGPELKGNEKCREPKVLKGV